MSRAVATFESAVGSLREAVALASGCSLSGPEAARLVELASQAERLAQSARLIATSGVVASRAWEESGLHRTPASWLASVTKGPMRAAIDEVDTAQRLASLPATRAAVLAGELSSGQAAEIARAALDDPTAELSLLGLAERAGFETLRRRCVEVSAAAVGDEERDGRIHASRYLRRGSTVDGAFRLEARLTQVDGVALWSAIEARATQLQTSARRRGFVAPTEAYAADALCELVQGTMPRRSTVSILVDATALSRGHTVAGETCKVAGGGPISVRTAARMIAESAVRAVGKESADVTRVVGIGRSIPPRLKTALLARDETCVVPGCGAAARLEIDHTIEFARTAHTKLDELARLCWFHHDKRTKEGWTLTGGPGAWAFGPPARAP